MNMKQIFVPELTSKTGCSNLTGIEEKLKEQLMSLQTLCK